MVIMTNKTYYEILGVLPNASQEEIESQGHFLIQAWHPDKFHKPEEKNRAAETIKEINEAYAILRDPDKRASYDWQIKVGQATGTVPIGQQTGSNPPSIPIGASSPSPIVAALLSFIIFGGAGQIYIQ
jgi:curved DNA-binding protein CbpA